MAQYNLSAGTQFKPFSFERYLQPLVAYNQAIQSQEDLASDLSTQANYWGNLANQQTDKKTYAQYKKYADDLKAQSDLLAEKGLYEGSRRAMLDLKNRYATEMVPIETAYKTKQKQMELQQTMRNQHPDIMYGRDASTTSLDKYLENPNYDATSQVYTGEMLKNTVRDAASALAKEAHANPNIKATLQKILPYQYYAELERTGFKSEDVYKAIHSADGSPILRGIVNDAIKGAGIDKWDNADTMVQRAYDYASPALYHAVGTTKFGPVTDQYGMQSALEDQRHKHALQEAEAAKQQNDYSTGLPVDFEDVSFEGQGQSQTEKVYGIFKDVLGISGGNGTKTGLHKITVTGAGRKGTNGTFALNKNGSKEFNVFDKKGYMLSKAQFMAQGKDAADKKALSVWYDNMQYQINYIGAKGTRHASNLLKKAKDYVGREGASYQRMPSLRFGDNKKVFESKVGGLINAGKGAYTIGKDLSSYQKGKRVKAEDILSEINDNGDMVSYNISMDRNHPGLVIRTAKGNYFVPKANMGTTARNALDNYLSGTDASNKYYADIKKNRKSYEARYGKEAVARVLAQEQNTAQSLTARAIRDIGFSVAGEYANPSAKLFQQPSVN